MWQSTDSAAGRAAGGGRVKIVLERGRVCARCPRRSLKLSVKYRQLLKDFQKSCLLSFVLEENGFGVHVVWSRGGTVTG